jgi:serine/threonine-protein kinase
LSLVACSGASDDEGGAAAAAPVDSPAAAEAPEPIAPLPPDEATAAAPVDADAGADAASDAAAPKHVIPLPGTGKLHAYTNTNDACAWTVNNVAKGTSSTLDLTLYVGAYNLTCKRADGTIATAKVDIVKDQTVNQVLSFPVGPGTLVAVAVGGTCSFTINGAAKGTTSQLQVSLPPGTYSVGCKANTGAQMSRSVIIKTGETAMAMFKIS